jgi:hypothetical protein
MNPSFPILSYRALYNRAIPYTEHLISAAVHAHVLSVDAH